MSTSTAQYVGGPADGKTETFPQSLPPDRVDYIYPTTTPSGEEAWATLPYVLRMNCATEGPLWLLTPDPEQ